MAITLQLFEFEKGTLQRTIQDNQETSCKSREQEKYVLFVLDLRSSWHVSVRLDTLELQFLLKHSRITDGT
jgi:hypothetical protein